MRHGDEVVISWDPLYLRAGDDSEWFPYLVEAWVCQDGRLVFTPLGSYETDAHGAGRGRLQRALARAAVRGGEARVYALGGDSLAGRGGVRG